MNKQRSSPLLYYDETHRNVCLPGAQRPNSLQWNRLLIPSGKGLFSKPLLYGTEKQQPEQLQSLIYIFFM